ncbi:MAG: pyridoxal phosphate-dependent aminotransferase [Gemmatimonadota bacterium]
MRAAYREIELYDPRRAPCAVDLSDNTNLFGIAPSLRRTLAELPNEAITRYPAVFAQPLKRALAELHGVEPDNIATGCGSDDLIDSAIRAFCEPGDAVAYPDPTFGIVRTFARMNAARPLPIPTTCDFGIDVRASCEADAPITYVCAPNNPTGTAPGASVVPTLDARLAGVLLLDEAYSIFGDVDYGDFAVRSSRTISIRTLSKAWGLAGLRIGYAIGPALLIREVEKSRGPYKVSTIAEAAALAVLEADRSWVAAVVAETRNNRARLARAFAELNVRQWPSAANFILVQAPDGWSADALATALRERGVAVRPFMRLRHAGDCIRVSIGPWEMLARLLDALCEVLR